MPRKESAQTIAPAIIATVQQTPMTSNAPAKYSSEGFFTTVLRKKFSNAVMSLPMRMMGCVKSVFSLSTKSTQKPAMRQIATFMYSSNSAKRKTMPLLAWRKVPSTEEENSLRRPQRQFQSLSGGLLTYASQQNPPSQHQKCQWHNEHCSTITAAALCGIHTRFPYAKKAQFL